MQLIKIGGGAALNLKAIFNGIKQIKDSGEQVIVVHGANAEMKNLSAQLNLAEVFLTSPSGQQFRYSDQKTMEVLIAAYCGIANKRMSALAFSLGLKAVGLSGIDGGLWLCERKPMVMSKDETGKVKIIRDNYHGKIISVNTELIEGLLKMGYTPIITVPGITSLGESVNIDNDTAIGFMVKALKIQKIISFIEAAGILQDFHDADSLIGKITAAELKQKTSDFSGRMQKKILGAIAAFEYGLEEMVISDGRVAEPFNFDFKTLGSLITN